MNPKSKRKSLVLASLAVFSSVALASSIALMNNFNHPVSKQDQLLNPINQRSVTDNATNSDRVKNPDEVFYTSVNLAEQDVWDDSATGGGAKPYKGAVDTTKKGYFDELKKKLEELEASGINSDAITQLKQISEEVDKYIKYKQLEQKWKDNNLDTTLSWEDVKEAIKGQLGDPAEEFEQINGLDTIGKYLLQLSGITSDEEPVEKIQQLTSKTVAKKDLVTASANPFATPPTTKAGVEDVAGAGYTTLVKIGEIDLTEQQNYMMEYSYASSSSAAPAKAYLIIKNDQGQVQKQESIKTAYQNLDIFGRYDNLNGSTIGQGSFKVEQENIVLRKVESETTKNNRAGKEKNTLEVLVRLKQGEVISNISFSKEHGTPKRFGILDVQADDKTTISKIIEKNNANGTGNDKLMTKPTTKATDPNTDEQLVKIQFFSSEYTSKKKTVTPFADDAAANRTIEIYQGYEKDNEDFEFSADLSYATKYSEQNSDYETIKEYVGGVATNKVVSLNLKFDGTSPSQINEGKSTYNFFALLKDNMDEEVKKLFPKVSLISATSEVKNKIAKQTIEYSDKFYLVGDVPKIGVDNSKEIKNKIPNLMDKIFAEKPKVWDETLPPAKPFRNKRDANQQTKANTTKKSTLQASEQVDEKVNVIKSLATIYKKWSDNDNAFASQNFEFEKAQVLFEPNGSSFKNISIQRNQFSGNGNALYKELTTYWNSLVDMINTVFNDQFSTNKDRYTITKDNTEQIIVDKFFINNFEFIPNYAKVDALIAEGIKVWNEDPTNKGPNKANSGFDSLSEETKKKFAQILAQLVQIQFDAIVKEFETNQMHPLYSEFQKVLASEDKSERTIVAEVGSLLTTSSVGGLIKYQEGAWETISSKKEETAKNQLLSLIRLLNFGQTNDDRTTLSDAILTNPIVALKFKEFNPENLVNFSDSQTLNTKLNQMRIIDGILSYFGYSFTDSYIDFINNVTPSFKLVFKYQGKPTDMNFAQVLEDIIVKLSQKGNEYRPTANESYSSYWLDNIITGTNIIRSMNWKLKQLSGALPPTPDPGPGGGETPGTFAAKAVKTQWQPQDVTARIYDILAQQQASPAEQAAWFSAITNGSKNFDVFASLFSGRGQTNDETIEKIFNALTKDEVIMERKNDFNEAFLTSVSQSLKYIWFILVALIGIGIMTSSALGIANRARQEKLSASHPMVKWLLFSLIALGAVVAILGLGIGIPALL